MDIEQVRSHCLAKASVTEDFPFNEDVLVFRVGGKIFLLVDLERVPTAINLKCDPARAIALRERYEEVKPGYHMNKKHWNTIELEGGVPDAALLEWIDHSFDLVAASLRKKDREALGL